ncbi:MAG: hypothetical protein KatS3mg085_272 [Candidatus Dojkabacteria bacterium]|nr:MAG: hypothetical protein KatS3mg085_272 [Candidatus Dojkabacteria bacterium]
MFTKVGVILKPSSPELKTLYSKVKSIFNREGFEVVLESASADMISEPNGIDFDDMAQFADLLISIGGDGTLISVARKSFKFNKPIVGIHAGNLGFLVDFLPEDIYDLVKELKVGNYKIEERIMLEVFLNSQPISLFAFNEIVLSTRQYCKNEFR